MSRLTESVLADPLEPGLLSLDGLRAEEVLPPVRTGPNRTQETLIAHNHPWTDDGEPAKVGPDGAAVEPSAGECPLPFGRSALLETAIRRERQELAGGRGRLSRAGRYAVRAEEPGRIMGAVLLVPRLEVKVRPGLDPGDVRVPDDLALGTPSSTVPQ